MIQDASSDKRKRTAFATSSGRPTLGISSLVFRSSSVSGAVIPSRDTKSVAIGPGATAFTRIDFLASSTDKALVSILTPPFEAL